MPLAKVFSERVHLHTAQIVTAAIKRDRYLRGNKLDTSKRRLYYSSSASEPPQIFIN